MKKESEYLYYITPMKISYDVFKDGNQDYTNNWLKTLNVGDRICEESSSHQVKFVMDLFKNGLPLNHGLKPMVVSGGLVEKHGIENIMFNYQRRLRNFSLAFVVLKFPKQYVMPMSQDYISKERDENFLRNNIVPLCVNEITGEGEVVKRYAPNYIHSVYINYPDCRRYPNNNWVDFSAENYWGMVYSPEQESLILNSDDAQKYVLLEANKAKQELQKEKNLPYRQLARLIKTDKELRVRYAIEHETKLEDLELYPMTNDAIVNVFNYLGKIDPATKDRKARLKELGE